jgi:RNA polymerase sigma-70 factor (sigma-E family)
MMRATREVTVAEPDGFRVFVAARSAALVRSAWLLTGNEATAQDLVQTALAKTWSRWSQVARQDAPEAYVRRVMVSTFLTWNRRRWRGETPVAMLPERIDITDEFASVDLRSGVAAALARLPSRQRAVIVMRFFDDLTEAQTALAMACSVGTVKSQTAKAIATLRCSPVLLDLMECEVAGDID